MSIAPRNRLMRRELYLLALYRLLEAALLALAVFGPLQGVFGGEARDPALASAVAATYLVGAAILLGLTRRPTLSLSTQVLFGLLIDIGVAALATHALPHAGPGIAMMLLFNVGAAALLLPLNLGLAGAALASAAMVLQYIAVLTSESTIRERPLAEVLMFSVSYLALATLTNHLGRDMRESRDLAQKRGAEAANLAEVNELIIRRMRVGVLMVDGDGRIRMANEAARILLGEAGPRALEAREAREHGGGERDGRVIGGERAGVERGGRAFGRAQRRARDDGLGSRFRRAAGEDALNRLDMKSFMPSLCSSLSVVSAVMPAGSTAPMLASLPGWYRFLLTSRLAW